MASAISAYASYSSAGTSRVTPANVTTAPARGSRTRSISGSSRSGSELIRTWATPTEPPDTGGISAISSPADRLWLVVGVLRLTAITTGHVVDQRQPPLSASRDPRPVGQLQVHLVGSGAIAQPGEQAHSYLHRDLEGVRLCWRRLTAARKRDLAYPPPSLLAESKRKRRHAFTEDLALRRRLAAQRGGDRGLREQQQLEQLELAVGNDLGLDERRAPSAAAQRLGAVAAVAAMVPAAIKSKGTITVAADASYAPTSSSAPTATPWSGWTPTWPRRSAAVMGLKINVVNATFDSIIPASPRASTTSARRRSPTPRRARRSVDFVNYFSAGTSFFTKASGGPRCGLADLCGQTVAVEKGTTEESDATAQGEKCKEAGKPAVTVLAFADQNGANLALSSGRAQVGLADSPVAAYAVKKSERQVQARRPDLRHRALRPRDPEEQRARTSGPGRAQALMSNGSYTSDPRQMGGPGRRDLHAGKINGATS